MLSVRFTDIVKRIATVSGNAEREAWWLLEASCGIRQHHLQKTLSKDNDLAKVLNSRQLATLLANVDDRVEKRKPLQYICADTYFCNLHLKTRPPVLIPRPETEQMVSWLTYQLKTYNEAISAEDAGSTGEKITLDESIDTEKVGKLGGYKVHRFRYSWYNAITQPLTKPPSDEDDQNPNHRNRALWHQLNKLRFLDVCSGSGNIALALAGQFPQSEVVGVDVDPVALALAKSNAQQCGFENVVFYPCDVFKPQATVGTFAISSGNQFDENNPHSLYDIPMLTSLYDIIISNPPYVYPERMSELQPEVKDWESPIALTPAARCYTKEMGIPPDFAKSGKWPREHDIRRLALPFYEKLVRMSPRLLNHSHHNQTQSSIAFPRIVMEIGDDEQAVPICDMVNELFDANIYLDTQEQCRWVVGFERKNW